MKVNNGIYEVRSYTKPTVKLITDHFVFNLLQIFFWKLIFFLLIFSIFLNQIFEKLNQKYWNFN